MQQFPDLSINKYDSEFYPHMTIAYRDIPQRRFKEIKAEYSKKEFDAAFLVEEFFLLRHDSFKWNILASYNFQISP